MSTSEDAQNNQNRLIGTPNLPAINLNVAGIDIGAKHHWVCLLLNRDTENVRRFISGLTGMAIIKAIVVGERDPKVLAALKDRRIKSSATEIAFDFMHIKGTLAYA